jgi:hypothetical protein
MNILTTQERVLQDYRNAVNDRRDSEVALTYFRQHQQFGWLNQVHLIQQMHIWRDLYKQGHLDVSIGENTINEKTYYTLILHTEEDSVCPDIFSLFVFNQIIFGIVYAFPNKENRRMVLNFLSIT